MFYYKIENEILVSNTEYPHLDTITESTAKKSHDIIYALNRLDPAKSRRSFSVSDPSLVFVEKEDLNILKKPKEFKHKLPAWLISKINERKVTSINTEYPGWQEVLQHSFPEKWKVNVVGLGDVGGTLVTGLRLLGGDCISKICIYGRDHNKIKRWEYESNQILVPSGNYNYPAVYGISEEQIFDCDMFIFCASVGIPPVGAKTKNVRMAQLEGNSRIISSYAKMARETGFKGVFAVVSDPVDLLCKVAFISGNTNDTGEMDFKGLAPEQIRGYGLGVMHARAVYYARQDSRTVHYLNEGRVFGPHGEDLIVANSIKNYNEELSLYLTDKARNANMDVRATGFKPYIAPALSSGSLSIIDTIRGRWHYSATYIGGVSMGSMNRLNISGVEIERLDIPKPLFKRLQNTYRKLGNAI